MAREVGRQSTRLKYGRAACNEQKRVHRQPYLGKLLYPLPDIARVLRSAPTGRITEYYRTV
jgi:hypothetical protein